METGQYKRCAPSCVFQFRRWQRRFEPTGDASNRTALSTAARVPTLPIVGTYRASRPHVGRRHERMYLKQDKSNNSSMLLLLQWNSLKRLER